MTNRLFLLIVACLVPAIAFAQSGPPKEVRMFVGGYTAGSSQGVYVYRYDIETGNFGPEPLTVTKAENPSWLTFSSDNRFLYAVNENGPGQKDSIGRVTSFLVDANGRLDQISQIQSLGDEPTFSSLSRDGRYLFVANYSVHSDPGGTLAVISLEEGGKLGRVTQVKTHRASQVNLVRQQGPHVHSVRSSPDGYFVFSADLGADRVYIYRYDPTNSAEGPLSAASPPYVELPAGSGPRHILFSEDGRFAYLTLEMAGSVVVFAHREGILTPTQQLPLASSGMPGISGGGALHFSPDNRFLYATNRGTYNEIVVYAVSAESGMLTPIQTRPADGTEPREFAFDPSGRRLLVANQFSNNIVVIARDPQTGRLGETIRSIPFSMPSFIAFARDEQ